MSSTGQSTSSTSNIQLFIDALADYVKVTGIDLSRNPFVAALNRSTSPEAILQLLHGREKAFKEYRDGDQRLISYLSPAVTILQAFSGILGEAARLVSHTCNLKSLLTDLVRSPSHQQAYCLLGSTRSLLCVPLNISSKHFPCNLCIFQAASGVSSSYDALLDLFECLGNFLKRLEIYTTIPPTPIMTNIIVKIMVQLLSVLALATKQIKEGRFSEYPSRIHCP
jgi:hypothetical protein